MAGDIFCQNKHCLFEHGDESIGVGNYLIGIRENNRLIHTVFMLDSHSYTEWTTPEGERDTCYAELPPVHMDWYEERIDEVRAEGCNHSSMFMHSLFSLFEVLTPNKVTTIKTKLAKGNTTFS